MVCVVIHTPQTKHIVLINVTSVLLEIVLNFYNKNVFRGGVVGWWNFSTKTLGLERRETGLQRRLREELRFPRGSALTAPDRLRALYAPALALACELQSRDGLWRTATRKASTNAAFTCALIHCATPPPSRCTFCPARSRLTGPPRWGASSPQPSAWVPTVSARGRTTAPGSPRAGIALFSARSGARPPGDRGPPEAAGGPLPGLLP